MIKFCRNAHEKKKYLQTKLHFYFRNKGMLFRQPEGIAGISNLEPEQEQERLLGSRLIPEKKSFPGSRFPYKNSTKRVLSFHKTGLQQKPQEFYDTEKHDEPLRNFYHKDKRLFSSLRRGKVKTFDEEAFSKLNQPRSKDIHKNVLIKEFSSSPTLRNEERNMFDKKTENVLKEIRRI